MPIVHRSEPERLARFRTLEQVQETYVRRVMRACEGDVTTAARVLGMGRATLYRWVDRMQIETQGERLDRERSQGGIDLNRALEQRSAAR